MTETIHFFIRTSAIILEIAGIAVILLGTIFATARFLLKKQGVDYRSFKKIRQELGRSILLGLEFLVGADIIATVTVDTSMDQILNLGVIVLIRTFLSFALEVEIEGKLPWKQDRHKTAGKK